MTTRTRVLKELVSNGLYVIDEHLVAEAMLVRSMALRMLPDMTFREPSRRLPTVRSFRPNREAQSFRLSRGDHRSEQGRRGRLELAA